MKTGDISGELFKFSKYMWNEIAAGSGNLQLLIWSMHQEGTMCDYKVFAAAAGSGNAEMIRLLRDTGCMCDSRAYENAARKGHIKIIELLHWYGYHMRPSICEVAAANGQLEILKWLKRKFGVGIDNFWQPHVCAFAAKYGHLETLKWLRSAECNCPWDGDTCCEAAASNQLDVLEWAVNNGAELTPMTFNLAAESGGATLKFLYKHGCPRDQWATAYAIQYNRLDVLKWMKTLPDITWTCNVTVIAAIRGYLDTLKWLVETGCPINVDDCIKSGGKNSEIVKYLQSLTLALTLANTHVDLSVS